MDKIVYDYDINTGKKYLSKKKNKKNVYINLSNEQRTKKKIITNNVTFAFLGDETPRKFKNTVNDNKTKKTKNENEKNENTEEKNKIKLETKIIEKKEKREKIETIKTIKHKILKNNNIKKILSTEHFSKEIENNTQLNKTEWSIVQNNVKFDTLSPLLIMGIFITKEQYETLVPLEKKRLLLLFHPDKNNGKELNCIICKKIVNFKNEEKID